MRKFIRAFQAMGRIISKPWLLNLVLDEDSNWYARIKRSYGTTVPLKTTDIRHFLNSRGCHLPVFAFLDGGSLPTDLALLRSLAASIPDCRYFEIGTWRGESVANVAGVAAHCHTLNLSPDDIVRLGLPPRYAELHGFFSRQLPNVTQLYGDSAQFDFAGLQQKFDLIFIDGDHHYEMVKSDTARVFSHLMHEKTVVVWHDAAFTPEKLRPEVIAGILDGTPRDCHRHIYHVSNTQCAMYYPAGIADSYTLDPPQEPHIRFELELRLQQP